MGGSGGGIERGVGGIGGDLDGEESAGLWGFLGKEGGETRWEADGKLVI